MFWELERTGNCMNNIQSQWWPAFPLRMRRSRGWGCCLPAGRCGRRPQATWAAWDAAHSHSLSPSRLGINSKMRAAGTSWPGNILADDKIIRELSIQRPIVCHSQVGSLLMGTSSEWIWAIFSPMIRLISGSDNSFVFKGRACSTQSRESEIKTKIKQFSRVSELIRKPRQRIFRFKKKPQSPLVVKKCAPNCFA